MPEDPKGQGPGDPFGGGGITGGNGNGGDGGTPPRDVDPPVAVLLEDDAEQGATRDASRRALLKQIADERARADQAQARAAELELALAQTREALDAVERRHRIDLALIEADAVDLDTARLLTDMAIAQMSSPDVDAAVSDLRRRKPFLFTTPSHASVSGAMSLHAQPAASPADLAADHAATTGNRRALLRYLRARRRD